MGGRKFRKLNGTRRTPTLRCGRLAEGYLVGPETQLLAAKAGSDRSHCIFRAPPRAADESGRARQDLGGTELHAKPAGFTALHADRNTTLGHGSSGSSKLRVLSTEYRVRDGPFFPSWGSVVQSALYPFSGLLEPRMIMSGAYRTRV